jgi:hypothetical protein
MATISGFCGEEESAAIRFGVWAASAPLADAGVHTKLADSVMPITSVYSLMETQCLISPSVVQQARGRYGTDIAAFLFRRTSNI